VARLFGGQLPLEDDAVVPVAAAQLFEHPLEGHPTPPSEDQRGLRCRRAARACSSPRKRSSRTVRSSTYAIIERIAAPASAALSRIAPTVMPKAARSPFEASRPALSNPRAEISRSNGKTKPSPRAKAA